MQKRNLRYPLNGVKSNGYFFWNYFTINRVNRDIKLNYFASISLYNDSTLSWNVIMHLLNFRTWQHPKSFKFRFNWRVLAGWKSVSDVCFCHLSFYKHMRLKLGGGGGRVQHEYNSSTFGMIQVNRADSIERMKWTLHGSREKKTHHKYIKIN